jgi:hypothetical protein
MYVNEWWRGCLRVMLPLVPLAAIAIPAHAQTFSLGCPGPSSCTTVDPPGLADTAEPGSVLIFPKFAQGSATLDNGATEPKIQIEIGAVCEQNTSTGSPASPASCVPLADIPVEVHWVCPGTAIGQQTSVCQENDFVVHLSTYGKIVFNPSGITPTGTPITGFPALNGTTPVPTSLCNAGYAIAFVINPASQPVGRNVLVGDSVQRNTVTGTDLQSYSALAIQAVTTNPGGVAPTISLGGDPDGPSGSPLQSLPFTGQPNQYQMVSGQFWGDVRFTQTGSAPFADTVLVLLTLDVRSSLQNNTTNVNLDFYNQKEVPISEAVSFDCWTQVQLTDIDPINLTNTGMGSPYGMVVSGQATDAVTGGFRTLLALIQVAEGPTAGPAAATRSYTIRPSNNSIPVATNFVFN